jgi:flagellar basal body-associated protein FliL
VNESPAAWKAAVWVAIVFLLGAAAGGMIGYGYAHRSVAAANTPAPEPERRAKRVAQLTGELSLSSDQAKQLDRILLQWHSEAKAIHDQSDAQIEQLRQKGRDQIRAILTADQTPKFEEFLRKLDEERRRNVPK